MQRIPSDVGLTWIILTMGDRPEELAVAAASVTGGDDSRLIVVSNGSATPPTMSEASTDVVHLPRNVGVPGGRNTGARRATTELLGFLDDDAVMLSHDALQRIVAAFDADERLAVLSFRILDESGSTSRRHVPRIGRRGVNRPGPVATFLGGACAIRKSAFDAVGGYWDELVYAHEELDLSWRLHDAGFDVRYDPAIEVRHPATDISRHADGWRRTGRNRVWVARRNLPWAIALPHVVAWLALGALRAPAGECRQGYVRGWRDGWRDPIERRPVGWKTVLRLTGAGRPPVV